MADRELDVRIAREVFGYETDMVQMGPILAGVVVADWHYEKKDGNRLKWQRVPRYSSDISAAWKVVEHMASMGLTVSVVYVASARCLCVNVDQPHHERIAELGEIGGPEIAPRVICRAALQALAATGSADRADRAGREGEA